MRRLKSDRTTADIPEYAEPGLDEKCGGLLLNHRNLHLHRHAFVCSKWRTRRTFWGADSLRARIVAAADTYDALTTNRPYRRARDHDRAVEEIARCAKTQFDPRVIDAFLRAFV